MIVFIHQEIDKINSPQNSRYLTTIFDHGLKPSLNTSKTFKILTFDVYSRFGISTSGNAQALTGVLPRVLSLYILNNESTIFRHTEPTVVLTRKHENLKIHRAIIEKLFFFP